MTPLLPGSSILKNGWQSQCETTFNFIYKCQRIIWRKLWLTDKRDKIDNDLYIVISDASIMCSSPFLRDISQRKLPYPDAVNYFGKFLFGWLAEGRKGPFKPRHQVKVSGQVCYFVPIVLYHFVRRVHWGWRWIVDDGPFKPRLSPVHLGSRAG